MDSKKRQGVKARHFYGAIPRIIEGVSIGLVVAIILLAQDWLVDHRDRQDEIAYIQEVVVAARLDISKAQAGDVAVQIQGSPRFRVQHRSREQAQKEAWHILTAKLSDVLAHRTSRLTYDEKRELRQRFPGITVDGRRLLGDSLDVIIRGGVSMHYWDIFSQAESIEWLGLPPASQEIADGLVPANRHEPPVSAASDAPSQDAIPPRGTR